jgi:hypothetical protein
LSSDLIVYDEACRAIAKAVSVDEVKSIRDKSEAMRAYAKQAMNLQLETDASEIRFRAERRLGKMIADQKDGPGLAVGGRPSKTCDESSQVSPSLAEALGMDSDRARQLSSRSQSLAGVSDRDFESHLSEWRDEVDESSRVATGKFYDKVKITSKPKAQLDAERFEISWSQGLLRNMGSLSDMPVAPKVAALKLSEYYSDDVSRMLPKAIRWLEKFQIQWEKIE